MTYRFNESFHAVLADVFPFPDLSEPKKFIYCEEFKVASLTFVIYSYYYFSNVLCYGMYLEFSCIKKCKGTVQSSENNVQYTNIYVNVVQ